MAYLLTQIPVRQLDNSGNPVSGAKLYTFASGTTTPLATFTDASGSTPLPNPVVADSQGFWPQIWASIDAYRLEARKADGVSVLWGPVDNIVAPEAMAATLNGSLRADLADATSVSKGVSLVAYNPTFAYPGGLGQFLNYTFGRTAAEIAASVTPTNYAYFPGDPRRYGAVGDDATDNATAFQKWAAVGGDMFLPPGVWRSSGYMGGAIRVLKGGCRIRGAGMGISILKPVGWVDGINIADNLYPAIAAVLPDVTITGLTIDGTLQLAGSDDTYGNGINLTACDVVSITGCELVNVQNQVIVSTYYSVAGSKQRSIDVSGNAIRSIRALQVGIGFEGASNNATCIGNRITGAANSVDAIRFSYNGVSGPVNGNSTISGNVIQMATGGTGRGIAVFDNVYQISIDGNVISGGNNSIQCSADGAPSAGYTITDNRCLEYTTGGVVLVPTLAGAATKAIVSSNTCLSGVASGSSYGIYVGEGTAVIGNHVFSGATGILTNGNNQRILNNVIQGPATSLDVSASTGVVVNGNVTNGAIGINTDTIYSPCPGFGGTVASAASITLPANGDTFEISGAATITSIVPTACSGRTVKLVFSGTASVTDGVNLKLNSSFTATADDTLTLTCIGTIWYEVGRSVN